jgi:sigma-B regulation protein RsbU (phosphoserine phosphatase)
VLFLAAIAYQVRFTVEQFPGVLGYSDMPRRPFYCSIVGDGPIQIYLLSPEARKSGLQSGDILTAVNQEPAAGTAVLGEALAHARVGDVLAVTVVHEGQIRSAQRPAEITLIRKNAGVDMAVLTISFVLSVVMPFFCLFLGFWVAVARPRNPQAWLLLGLMLSFAAFITPTTEAWGPHWRVLATIYYRSFNLALPIFALLFGIYFPEPFPAKQQWPWWNWAKWLVGVPLVLFGAAQVISAVGEMENRASVLALDRLLAKADSLWDALLVATFVVFVACLVAKWRLATSSDAKRRLQLLLVGVAVGLAPKLILIAIADFHHQELETYFQPWIYRSVLLLQQVVFPLTLAYAIVVYRAMDIRVVVRHGLQYALATRAILVLQLLVTTAVITVAVYVPTTTLWSGPRRFFAIVLGVVLMSRLGKGADWLRAWTDRRFFRDAYNAELILSDLGENVRTIVETGPLLETVAGRIADSLHVRRVAVMLDGSGPYRPAYSIGFPDGLHVIFSGDGAVVRRLEKEKEPSRIYFGDPDSWIYRDPEMTDEQRIGLTELDSELLIPLSVKHKLIGFMSLGQKSSEEPYSGNDLRLLKSVATQIGMALEVASLTTSIGQEIAQRERVNRELEIAREVQERLFPQVLPAVLGLDYCGRCQPAREVGGDYYDFFELPGKKLGIAIGDVSGKGIGAALMMAGLQASLRAQASIAGHSLAVLMSGVNRLLYEVSSENRYATFFYAQYDPCSRQLTYVNAGHNPPLVLRKSGSEWRVMRLDVGGTVVGLLRQPLYAQGAVTFELGDVVVAFTDGVSEAMNVQDEEWGEENLIAVAETCAGLSAAESVSRILAAAHAFTAGAPQHDDMTVVVLQVLSNAGGLPR